MRDQSLIPILINRQDHQTLGNALSVMMGIAILSALAQISIPLPWTPVPITGQTFGVAIVALNFGRKRALLIVGSYLCLGAAGLPVFAHGSSGLGFGPTTGYLVGMFLAAALMGTFADLGWTKTFPRAWLATFLGSVLTFACGLLVLSFFLPPDKLLWAGVFPFLPGDIVKTLLASVIAHRSRILAKELP